MKAKYRVLGKKIFSRILPDSTKLRHLLYMPRLQTFRKKHAGCKAVKNRKALFDYLQTEILANQAINYCEFGVYKGASIRYWSKQNSVASSRFYGFDTFTGLPEQWHNFTGVIGQEKFDVEGQLPNIEDSRVSFVKGLFQDTLPKFLDSYSNNNVLVIHADADLYSSTLYFLTQMNDVMVSGTIIIFDEFSSMLHEFRALEDYCAAYLRNYEVLVTTVSEQHYYTQLAIRML